VAQCPRGPHTVVKRAPKAKRMLGTWRIDSTLVRQILQQASSGKRRKFRRHETLYEQGTTSTKFYLVLSGLVQVSIVRVDGIEVVLEYMGPETICGEGAAFDCLPRFSSAIAVEDTETIEFDAARIEAAIFRQHPEFASALLRVASLKQRVLAVRLEHLSSRSPEVRIMDLLQRLQEMFAVDYAGARLLVTHLTHEQIAAMPGTSRVTVTRSMRCLRDEGKIDIIDGHILVKAQRK
jgi:CRP/FNR family transcriptional regulator, cyclic AMP receptor protein